MKRLRAYDIAEKLAKMYSNQEYILHNTYVFRWESDFFCISNSGYVTEVEIKISKSDFKADFNKTTGTGIKKHDYLINPETKWKPNKFIFACPEGLINPDDIDNRYGLIYINRPSNEFSEYTTHKIIQNAKFLHKEKLMQQKRMLSQLLSKYYYRNMDLRKSLAIRDWDIKYNQRRLYDDKLF